MADDAASHRQFHVWAVAGAGAGADDPDALTDEEADKAVVAYTWPDFAEVRLFPRAEFANYATPFEHAHSSLLVGEEAGFGNPRTGEAGKYPASPIVDDKGEVIMYLGWFDWSVFELPSDMVPAFEANTDPAKVWEFQIVISDPEIAGMSHPLHPEMVYLVLATKDGTVLQILDRNAGRYGDMSSIQPGDLIAIFRLIAALGIAGIEYVAAKGAARVVGRVSVDEMEVHLTRILRNRPELRRLIDARLLSGDALRAEVRGTLDQWAKQYGKQIEYAGTEEMKKVTSASNLMTLQPPGIRSKLLINKVLLDPGSELEFFEQTAHELVADALGWSGGAGAHNMAFVCAEFRNGINTAQTFLENAIKHGADIAAQLKAFRGGEF